MVIKELEVQTQTFVNQFLINQTSSTDWVMSQKEDLIKILFKKLLFILLSLFINKRTAFFNLLR